MVIRTGRSQLSFKIQMTRETTLLEEDNEHETELIIND